MFGNVPTWVDTAVRRMLWSDGPDQGSDPGVVEGSSRATGADPLSAWLDSATVYALGLIMIAGI